MQWPKKLAWVILLNFFVINIALAAPVLVQETREVCSKAMDVAEDVVAALLKRRKPTDESLTNAPDPGGVNTPPPPPSTTTLSADSNPSHLSQESQQGDHHSPPVNSHPPADTDLPQTSNRHPGLGLKDTPSGSPSPGPAHDNLESNAPPQLSPRPPDQDNSHTLPDNSHTLPMGSPPPAHNKLPLDVDSNIHPQEPIDNSHLADFGMWSDLLAKMYPSPWVTWKYPSTLPSPADSPSHPGHDDLGEDSHHLPSNPGPEPTDEQPPSADPPSSSHPGPSKRPLENPSSDQGPPKKPEPDDPLIASPLRWLYPSTGPGPSTSARPSHPGPSTWVYPGSPSDTGSSTWLYPPSFEDPSSWAHPLGPSILPVEHALPFQGSESSTWLYPLSRPQPPTLAHPPPDPTWLYPPSGPGPSTLQPPSRPPTEPRPEHETEINLGEVIKDAGKLKRHVPGSRPVDSDADIWGVAGYP